MRNKGELLPMETKATKLPPIRHDLLQHIEFIEDIADIVSINTGEVFTPQQLNEAPHSTPINSSKYSDRDKYGAIYEFKEYKYRNNLKRTSELLGITDRKCNQLNTIYLMGNSYGLVDSITALKKLGKDYRRSFKRLSHDGWLTKVTFAENSKHNDTCDYWMMNPEFTIVRNVWSTKRQEWLRDCFNNKIITKYVLAGHLPNTDIILEENQKHLEYKERQDTLYINSEMDEFTAYMMRKKRENNTKPVLSSAC